MRNKNPAAVPQPQPHKNDETPVVESVVESLRLMEHCPVKGDFIKGMIDDIESRSAVGTEKYKTKLKPHNGRHALMDAYQEALDLLMYVRQHDLETGQRISILYEEAFQVALLIKRMLVMQSKI